MTSLNRIALLLSISTFAACSNGGGKTSPQTGKPDVSAQNTTESNKNDIYPYWVPFLTEYYSQDGSLTACIRSTIDSDGYVLNSTFSSSDGLGEAVSCDDTDKYTNYSEFTFNADRTVFTTYSESTFSKNVECQKVFVSENNVPYRIETYVSASGNYTCSPEIDDLFSITLIELEDGMFETSSTTFTGPGKDEKWETEDDTVNSYSESAWTSDKLNKKTISYVGPGPDQKWQTDDDIAYSSEELAFKAIMIPSYSYTMASGVDANFMTEDDIVTGFTEFVFKSGAIEKHTSYGSPGNDGIWETTEDNMVLYEIFY